MMSDKIRPHHLGRKAILYVRQSSSHQVLHNRESRALQYAMRDRLTTLGWSEIEIIDDDLSRSAAGSVARAGFERMVAEVCLGKVGAVAAREVSRFARNSRDQVRSPRDKRDLGTSPGEARSDVRPKSASTHDRDTHVRHSMELADCSASTLRFASVVRRIGLCLTACSSFGTTDLDASRDFSHLRHDFVDREQIGRAR